MARAVSAKRTRKHYSLPNGAFAHYEPPPPHFEPPSPRACTQEHFTVFSEAKDLQALVSAQHLVSAELNSKSACLNLYQKYVYIVLFSCRNSAQTVIPAVGLCCQRPRMTYGALKMKRRR